MARYKLDAMMAWRAEHYRRK